MMLLLRELLAIFRISFPVFLVVGLPLAALTLVPLGWHIHWCIGQAAHGMQPVALLVAGMAFPPLGWAHGMSLLLGYGGWL